MSRYVPAFVVAVILLTALILVTYIVFGGQKFLVADYRATPADLGIPGITKWYSVVLANKGIFPVRISACDVTGDAGQQGIEVANAIQKWNSQKQRWINFWRIPRQEYCQRSADILMARPIHYWLWPGSQITTGAVAIQASDAVALGDRLRFVAYPWADEDTVILTPTFVIDERPKRTYGQ